jgi:type I restriction enzyme S subunit
VSDGKEAARLPAGKAGAGGARRYKPYPAYKDSGVEWLGEIPAHWEVKRITELMAVVNGFPFDSEHFVRGDGVPLVRIRDLCGTETEVNYTGPIVEDAWIETGDLIVGMDGDFNVARWRGSRALLNQRMCCLRARSGTNPGFVAYLLPIPLKVINELTYSTTVKHLSSNDVRKVRLGFPPEPEQRAIAAFLDRETARIDALVAKKERLIALLQEQRTALITRAVTKGLDPTVPMKDSGVEWLGEIPAHWEASRLGSGFREWDQRAGAEPGELLALTRQGLIPRSEVSQRASVADDYSKYKRCEPGMLVMNKMQAWNGAFAVADRSGIVSPDYTVFASRNDWSVHYFMYLLQTKVMQAVFLGRCRGMGTAFLRLNTPAFAGTEVPLPPEPEQRAIAAFLDRETARIDALVTKVREAIERLKELRTALISAAVTGKIDVREEASLDGTQVTQ